MPFESGNQEGRKRKKVWSDAISRALERVESGKVDYKGIDELADKLLAKAREGDMAALKEIGDRLDGKPAQAITGEDGKDLIPETDTAEFSRRIAFILSQGTK